MTVRDEQSAIPIGSYQRELDVTLSLPSIVGRSGVTKVLRPELSAEEQAGLKKSAENLRAALQRIAQLGSASLGSTTKVEPHLR
jgi:L-lactate dehydrogenase